MNSKHIDNVTMALYATGYKRLKKARIKYIQTHMAECDDCMELFMKHLKEASLVEDLNESEFELDILEKIGAILSLPLRKPLSWNKLKELSAQLVEILPEFPSSLFQDKQFSLVTKGYGYYSPSTNQKDEGEEGKIQKEQNIGERFLLLLEILQDDKIPFSKRAALVDELIQYASQKTKELEDSPSLSKSSHVDKEKDSE